MNPTVQPRPSAVLPTIFDTVSTELPGTIVATGAACATAGTSAATPPMTAAVAAVVRAAAATVVRCVLAVVRRMVLLGSAQDCATVACHTPHRL
ncbi:hypothetical protein MTP03_39440 [Tsukamurella sp. PLM1]|nr:hypothetical protein MTP03_39440 [Tsukamurella sp. PLM1]